MKGIGEAEVSSEFERKLKKHDRTAAELIEEAKRIGSILNKPAAEWAAKDLQGKAWSHTDLKGKVVVMDFWYRGCGWCMFAMPQVKQLAADYKDKPVVVLGMNTDRKDEDAQLVVKELGMKYPQMKAEGLPQRFGVQGFPTLVIIDQAGIVRGFHVGYRADLRQKVSKRIDELLQKNPG
jgi:thiol-disulfide isomerase/thioredoxin